MPIGSSAGAATMRAKVSATSSRIAPRHDAAGSSRRWPGPITSRSRCGTTMPTKPITPATDDGGAGRGRDQHDRDALEPLDRDAHVERFRLAQHDAGRARAR